MNCAKFQKLIDESFSKGDFFLSDEIRRHLEICSTCAAFAADLRSLQGVLDRRDFAVRPGELDGITFENIIAAKPAVEIKRSVPALARFLRWAWVPAAVSALILVALIATRGTSPTGDSYTDTGLNGYTNQELVNQISSSDSLGTEFLVSLAGDDDDFTDAADELLSGADLDEILDGLTSDELKTLYSKLDDLKG
jgi:hypothetical protein